MKAKDKLTAAEHRARKAASAKGMFLFVEGRGDGRKWSISDTTSGFKVATYFPKSGRCLMHPARGNDFVEPDHLKMLNTVLERLSR